METRYGHPAFDALADSFHVLTESGPLPGSGDGYRIGAVTPAFRSREAVERFIDSLMVDAPGQYRSLSPARVGDPWEFMRFSGGHGIVGIAPEGDWSTVFPGIRGFQFMTRFGETGRDMPTVLEVVGPDGPAATLGVGGAIGIDHQGLDHWHRYDLADGASAVFGRRSPFRDWDPGDPFFEVSTETTFAIFSHADLTGPWTKPLSIVPLFVTRQDAEVGMAELVASRLAMAEVHRRSHGGDPGAFASVRSYQVREVTDLQMRIPQYQRMVPGAIVVINPDANRSNSGIAGCGRQKGGAAWWERETSQTRFWLRTAAGVWKIERHNQLQLVARERRWSGRDTLFWNGAGRFQLASLPHTLQPEPLAGVRVPPDLPDDALNDLGRAVVATGARLDQPPMAKVEDMFVFVYAHSPGHDQRQVTYYPSVMHLIADLGGPLHTLGSVATRAGNARFGFVKSEDRSERLMAALTTVASRILRRGYVPADATDLIRVVNASEFLPIHAHVAGYVRDLVWTVNPDERTTLERWCGLDAATVERLKLDPSHLPVHPGGARDATARMGEVIWHGLLPVSRHFVATALWDWTQRSESPFLDYASVSVELSKAVEVELRRATQGFAQLDGIAGCISSRDRIRDLSELALAKMVRGTAHLTLGNYPFLLDLDTLGNLPLLNRWREFVAGLPCSGYLLSEHGRDTISRVSKVFRNGGAHDSPIGLGTCRDAIDTILGTAGGRGVLARLVAPSPGDENGLS